MAKLLNNKNNSLRTPLVLALFVAVACVTATFADNKSMKFEKTLQYPDEMYKKYFGKSVKEKVQEAIKKEKSKRPTLLIFSSRSVPFSTVNNYLNNAKQLNLKTYLVYRGLDNDLRYMLQIRADSGHKFIAKIHPMLFHDLNITRVPVLVFALCPKKFRSKQCDYEYKMTGDASLSYFFELASEKGNNKEMMKEYYHKLNEAK